MSRRQQEQGADFKLEQTASIDPRNNFGTEGLLIPYGYDRHTIPELYPKEKSLPSHPKKSGPQKPWKKQFETEEAKEEYRLKRNESSRIYRAKKRAEKLAAQDQQQKTDINLKSALRRTNTTTRATKRVTFVDPSAQDDDTDTDIDDDNDDDGRQLPPGYSHAEPYTAERRYFALQEKAERLEKERLGALDEVTMLKPVIEHLQAQDPNYQVSPKSSQK